MIIRQAKEEKKQDPRPSLGQLKAWSSDEITVWILKQLHHKFPDYRQMLPMRSQESILMLNYRAGCREVIEAIANLVENGEIK